jgi:TolB-like protein
VSLFAELKRRNVFRVGAAYLVSAWLLIEVADTVFPRLGLPDWTVTFVIVLALLGLPLALFLSWAYELTPDGVKRSEEVEPEASVTPRTGRHIDRLIVIALLGVIVLLVAERLWFAGADSEQTTADEDTAAVGNGAASDRAGSPSAPAPAERTIAVLPFANLSSDAENAYFADGLTEEVLNWLAKVPGLKVAGRTSSFHFKDRNEDLRSIGSQLGVAHVLEGSVRKSGQRLRITAQLIKVEDGFHLWSDTFDRELDDIFAIQDEIARAIVEALKLELGAAHAGTRPATESLPAYERLLEARTLIARRGFEGLSRAIVLLDEAVRLDPEFAAAWGALAQAHSLAHYYDSDPNRFRQAALARAEAAARKALQLDPGLASAHQALGDVQRDRFLWLEAEANYRRALELNPNEVEANSQYAQMLGRLGLPGRALPYVARAIELDPLAAVPLLIQGASLVQTGAPDAGLEQVQRARSLAPELDFVMMVSTAIHIELGDIAAALEQQRELGEWMRIHLPEEPFVDLQTVFFEHPDDRAAILAHLRDRLASNDQSSWDLIPWSWAAHFGDPQLALDMMRSSLRRDGVQDTIWAWMPSQAPMRRLPGFGEYAIELKLPDYWRRHGWPADCRPLAGDAFECGLGTQP